MTTAALDELLLQSVPEAPANISAPELARFAARLLAAPAPTLRTIQRTLERLRQSYPDLWREDSKPHRWQWKPGTKRGGLTRLDPATALVFSLVEKHLDGLIPPPFRAELESLFRKADDIAQKLPQTRLKRWKSRATTTSSAYPLQLPTVEAQVLTEVQRALLDRTQLTVTYRGSGQDLARDHLLHPQGLVLVDGVFYLVATVGGYSQPCQFALHRIERAQGTTEASRDLPGFDASAYAREEMGLLFKSGKLIKLRLRICGFLPLHLRERPMARDQTILPIDDDWSELRATVPESAQLEWWLASFGAQVEVLAPVGLRRRMARSASALHSMYARDLRGKR
jgi:predicted DNA-binding transcriptional regulator YafY